MTIREGKWDCPQCGKKGNRGSELKCPACGKVRGDEIRFYVEDDAAEVVDQAALAKAAAGADWICQFCDALNPAGGAHCKSCGAERAEKKREVRDLPLEAPPAPEPPKKSGRLWLGLGGLAVLGAFLLCRSSTQGMQVARVEWERTIAVERFATVEESGWESELPQGARIKYTERKLHHTDQVQTGTRPVEKTVEEKVQTGTRKVKTGTKDLGNGYFQDQYREEPVYTAQRRTVHEDEPVYQPVPVYRDWCRYDVDKWVEDHLERANGNDGEPRWPPVSLAQGQREGKKTEKYTARFKDAKGKEYAWEPPFDVWQKLRVGESREVVVKLGSITGLAEGKQ